VRTLNFIKWASITIGVLLAIYFVSIYVFGSASIFTAPFRGQVEKANQVEGQGEYVVAAHDKFYRLCSDIQAKQQNIKVLEEAGEEDAVTANKVQLNEMVSEYNADAANNYTKGQFRADELPWKINAEEEVESCGTP
jgi:hypothetical protein